MNAPSGKRQTLSFLRELFQTHGLKPKNKLGQNFLIDLNLIDYIVRQAGLTGDDMVLEVGTGTGGLTSHLARAARCVLTIEVDRDFHQLARETSREPAHVRFLLADVLHNKNHLNPLVLEQLAAMQQEFQPKTFKLIANLPYAVATPLIANLLMSDLVLERMVVTVQWEIAARLMAEPGTKDYGGLSILVRSLADVEVLRKLPPAVFWPRPQVESAIVRLWPRPHKKAAIADLMRFRVFVRDLYTHRRKNLREALAAMLGRGSKSAIDAKLAQLGFDGNCRAETLDIAAHHRLCAAFSLPVDVSSSDPTTDEAAP